MNERWRRHRQTNVDPTEPKTEAAVNFVKPKPNRKPQFFAKPNRKPNQSHFLPTAHVPYHIRGGTCLILTTTTTMTTTTTTNTTTMTKPPRPSRLLPGGSNNMSNCSWQMVTNTQCLGLAVNWVTTLQILWNSLTIPWRFAALLAILTDTHSTPVLLVLKSMIKLSSSYSMTMTS